MNGIFAQAVGAGCIGDIGILTVARCFQGNERQLLSVEPHGVLTVKTGIVFKIQRVVAMTAGKKLHLVILIYFPVEGMAYFSRRHNLTLPYLLRQEGMAYFPWRRKPNMPYLRHTAPANWLLFANFMPA